MSQIIKKRRKDDWGDGDITASDVENLIPMVEAEKEKGGHWDEEDLTASDVDNLIDAEKEKGQSGGDVGGEHDVEHEPHKFKSPIALCPSAQEEVSTNT